MPDGPQRCSPAECSLRKLARKIESRIFRNALDEEERAQKALYLLQARDRQIAFLEQRVAELEGVAANLHELTLRHSSRSLSGVERGNAADTDLSRSEGSFESDIGDDTDRKNAADFDITDSTRYELDEAWCEVAGANRANNRVPVPCLKLSNASLDNSERDVFSTATDLPKDKRTSDTSLSRGADIVEMMIRREAELNEEAKPNDRTLVIVDDNTGPGNFEEEMYILKENVSAIEGNVRNKSDEERDGAAVSNEKITQSSTGKHGKITFPRTSASVSCVRGRYRYRKKLRSVESKAGKRLERGPTSARDLTAASFGTIEGASMDRRQGEGEMVDGVKKIEKIPVGFEKNDERAVAAARETRLIAENRLNIGTKTICTQTSTQTIHIIEKNEENAVENNFDHFTPSRVHLEQKKLSAFWSIDEDPAPQWLIEEALNRGTERSDLPRRKGTATDQATEYERTISELEAKLARTREKLEEVLRSKSAMKEKYKKHLETVKTQARTENEILQESIVRIYTSVLENFGPRCREQRRETTTYRVRYRKPLKSREGVSIKLHRKLRMAVARSNKLKRELAETRRTLKNKSEEYRSISECFDQLKQEMDSTETNLNNLIAENLSLRKKMEDTRDWLKHGTGKEHHNSMRFRDMQMNRELSNLKKKVEEDWTTIGQLRNKLVRLESANANKGFLLNSYKSQVTDLNKEKSQLVSKISSLEAELSNVRSSRSQLKARISVLSMEKDRLLSDNERSKSDVLDKTETQRAKKHEESVQQEIETIKCKYEETIKSMQMKMTAMRNQNVEYSRAIKEFVKKLYACRGDRETPLIPNKSEESEREAHQTACNILNMTPEELSGFINGRPKNSANPWVVELNRITSIDHFSEDLSKFLFKKATKKGAKT